MKSDYWESKNKIDTYKEWLSEWEGCVLCNCDHGCNQWIVENAAKALSLFRALNNKLPRDELNKITQKHTKELFREETLKMFKSAKEAVKKRREKAKDETES